MSNDVCGACRVNLTFKDEPTCLTCQHLSISKGLAALGSFCRDLVALAELDSKYRVAVERASMSDEEVERLTEEKDWLANLLVTRNAVATVSEETIRAVLASVGVTCMQGKQPSELLAEIVHDADGWVLDHSGDSEPYTSQIVCRCR